MLDSGQAHEGRCGASPWQPALSLSWLGRLHAAPFPLQPVSVSSEVTMAMPLFPRPGPASLPAFLSNSGWESSFSVPARLRAPADSGPTSELGPDPGMGMTGSLGPEMQPGPQPCRTCFRPAVCRRRLHLHGGPAPPLAMRKGPEEGVQRPNGGQLCGRRSEGQEPQKVLYDQGWSVSALVAPGSQ